LNSNQQYKSVSDTVSPLFYLDSWRQRHYQLCTPLCAYSLL